MEITLKPFLVLPLLFTMLSGSVDRAHPGPCGYLVCHTGVALQILPNRTIFGTKDVDDPYAVVQLIRTGNTQKVFIYGVESRMFLCMTMKNKAIARRRQSKSCLFTVMELQENFKSFSHNQGVKRIYFGLTRRGKPKIGIRRSGRTKFIWKPQNYKEIQNLKKSVNWLQLHYTNVLNTDTTKIKPLSRNQRCM